MSLYACVRKKNGRTRMIRSGACEKGEYLVVWNIVGPPGARGVKGPTGVTGPLGPQGTVGSQGPVGPPDGSTVLSGQGQPSVEVGKPGDFYVDLQDWSMWGPKTIDSWTLGTSLIGPAGSNGARGPSGPQGAEGQQGVPGGFGAYGSFDDTASVSIPSSGAIAISLRRTLLAQGVSIVDSTKITAVSAGVYKISFSTELVSGANQSRIVTVWLNRNGTPIPWTSTDVSLATDVVGERQVLSVSFLVAVEADDAFEIMITANGASVQLFAGTSANSSNGAPDVPSTILTVNQVG